MFENINEIFEHLEFDNEKGTRLLRIITTAGVALILYESFGGAVNFPKDLDMSDVVHFFLSYQVFIPILFYFLSWIFFITFIPFILKMITYVLFEVFYYFRLLKIENKYVGETSPENMLEIVDIISKFTTKIGLAKFDLENWLSSENMDKFYNKIADKLRESVSMRFGKMIFFIQLMIIYLYKLQEKIVFVGSLNTSVKLVLGFMIIGQFLIITFTLFSRKLMRFTYKIFKKHPKINLVEPRVD